jgi:hypothetical protein
VVGKKGTRMCVRWGWYSRHQLVRIVGGGGGGVGGAKTGRLLPCAKIKQQTTFYSLWFVCDFLEDTGVGELHRGGDSIRWARKQSRPRMQIGGNCSSSHEFNDAQRVRLDVWLVGGVRVSCTYVGQQWGGQRRAAQLLFGYPP